MARHRLSWLLVLALWSCGSSQRHGGGTAGTLPDGAAGEADTAGGADGMLPNGGSSASGGSAAGGSDTAGGVALDDYAKAYAAALCQLIERCWQTYALSALESCSSSLEREFSEGAMSNLISAVEDGRLEYQPQAAAACLSATASASCEAGLLSTPESCDQAFVGSLELGEDCTLDAECGALRQCEVRDGCPGSCAERPVEGEPCEGPNRCADGLLCLSGLDIPGVCMKPAALGERCTRLLPCGTLQVCLGLDRSDPESSGSCASRDALYTGELGDDCALGEQALCSPALVCVFDAEGSSTQGHCAARVPSGVCQLAVPDQCARGSFCRMLPSGDAQLPSGECTPNPQLGEQCSFPIATGASFTAPCAAGQYCSTVSKNCELGMHLGEACDGDEACYSGHCVEGKCVAPFECE